MKKVGRCHTKGRENLDRPQRNIFTLLYPFKKLIRAKLYKNPITNVSVMWVLVTSWDKEY